MKVTKMANGPGDSRPTDANSLLEQRLADLQVTVRHRQRDWASALATPSDSQGNLADVVRRERSARAALEQQLAERQAQYEIDIARADAVRAMIDEQIHEAALAVERARHAERSALVQVSRLRQAEADAVARLAEREEQFATELSTITATRVGLDRRVADVEAALLHSSERLSREQSIAAERLATYQQRIEQETAARRGAEETLASAQTAHADAQKRHESALSDAAAALAERERELSALLAEAAAIRGGLERRLLDTEAALSDAQQQQRSALAVAATRLAEREVQFKGELSSITATRDRLARQVRDIHATLTHERRTREEHERSIIELRSAAETAEQRFREQIDTVTENARADHARLEDQMSRAQHHHQIQLTTEQDQHRSALAVAATRLAEQEAQFRTELVSIGDSRDGLEQQLRDVETTLTQETESRTGLEQELAETRSTAAAAEQRFRDEIDAFTESARADQARLEDQMSRARRDHESQLTNEQQQHRSALATAATRLAEREAQFKTELASIAGSRDGLERQLHDIETRLTQESQSRTALEQALTELRSTGEAAEQRFRDEIGAITESARAYQARLEDQMSRERRDREIELTNEQEQHRSALAVAATRLAEREAQFATELASIAGSRDAFEQQLRDVETKLTQETTSRAALEQALTELRSTAAADEQRFRGEIAAITESARSEQAGLEDQMARARHGHEIQLTELRSAAAAAEQRFREQIGTLTENARVEQVRLEDQMSHERRDHESQLTNEQQQHRSALAVAASRLAEREAQFRTELASIAGSRDGLERQLQDVETKLTQETTSRSALEQALTELRSAAAADEQRFRGEIDTLTENARAEQARLEDQMSRERGDHEIQLTVEQEQHRSTLAVAATRLAEREAQFETELASIAGSRDSLEQQLRDVAARLTQQTESHTALEQVVTDLRSTAAADEQRFRGEIDAITENARAEQARLEEQMSRERHAHEIQLTNEQEQYRSALAVAATRLAGREAQLRSEITSITGSRDGLERRLQDMEARLTQETESRTALEQALTELRTTAAADEQRFRDEIGTITENAVTERARLEEQMSNQRALAADRLAERGAEFEAELKRLSEDNATAVARLRLSIAERDSRLDEGGRVSAALRSRLDASENENRRQFEETSVPLIRCSRDVSVAGANRAFAALVGWRAHGELQDESLAAIFESRDDLTWLTERSINTGKTESIETTCIKKNGTRIAVRLSARACVSGLVEIAAEDLTAVRVLEDRLREARRMESVGRLASEIAVTCEKLLNGVHRDAQRLLTATGAERPQRSEVILDEVTRVGSFLHQLVAYGHEQAAALAPVDLNSVLRHLEPVLRQVAGDSVTLELRKTSSPVSVDVNAERVERLLVNVASYGRERMPNGGRLQIELSTVVVDGTFIAQHPNVRQGPHALITVTEVPRPAAQGSVSDHDSTTDARLASTRPGVDLGALQELISECGGHLWITAEPGGSMVVKMRLPLRAAWEHSGGGARHRVSRATARLLGR